MKCVKCGSENVNVSRETQSQFKQKHSIVWWLLVSWWYLPVKWIYKYLVVLLYYMFFGFWKMIYCSVKGIKYVAPDWVKPSKRRGKLHQDTKVVCVCQNCGASWEVDDATTK